MAKAVDHDDHFAHGLPVTGGRELVRPRRSEEHVAGVIARYSEWDRLNSRTCCRESCWVRRCAAEFADTRIAVAEVERLSGRTADTAKLDGGVRDAPMSDQHFGGVPGLEVDDCRSRFVDEASEPQRTDSKSRALSSRLLRERRYGSALRLLHGGSGCGGKGVRGVAPGARDER
jgi:hypothetical protein